MLRENSDSLRKIRNLIRIFSATPKTIVRHGISNRLWSFKWNSPSEADQWNTWVTTDQASKAFQSNNSLTVLKAEKFVSKKNKMLGIQEKNMHNNS